MSMAGEGLDNTATGGPSRLAQFRDWWRRGLRAWLPRRWALPLGWSDDRLLLSRHAGEVLLQWDDAGNGAHELARLPVPLDPAQLDRILGPLARPLPRWWLLPAAAGLHRRLRLPAAAAGDLARVATFEIDRQTPFQPGDVYCDVRATGRTADGQLEVDLFVVPRHALDAVLREQGELGAKLAGVDVADAAGRPLGFNLLPPPRRWRRPEPMRNWNLALLALAALLMVLAATRILHNRAAAADALQAQVDARAREALLVSAQLDRLAGLAAGETFLRQAGERHPAVLPVLDELTRLLPQDTHLQRLYIEGGRIELVGYSAQASALVPALEGSPLWRRPALAGTLRADAASGRDRFTLTAELAGTAPVEAADGDAR